MGMYRRPVMRNLRRGRVSRQTSIPAPVGGWNTRDPISGMPETDAWDIENFLPKTFDVKLRSGYLSHATGLGASVESLFQWAGPSSREYFAAAGGNIYEVTAGGAVGAAVVSGQTNARWQHVMFSTSTGNWLIICNGADPVQNYNGAAWATTPAITGVTPADLIHVNLFKFRLYFVEKNSTSVWYLGTNAIGGAATKFDLGPLMKKGGHLRMMSTWTIDGGNGVDDFAVFLTSEGEVIVFQGLNPGDASWSLKGVYQLGRPPAGHRFCEKFGGDLMLLTEDGYVFLSRALGSTRGSDNYAASEKIQGAVLDAMRTYRDEFGWEICIYPRGQYGLVNVPQGFGVFIQHVFNLETGAWTRFRNQNAFCWELFDDEIYFGADEIVYKADTGTSDAGSNINGYVRCAFSYFGSPGVNKRFTGIRPIFSSGANVSAGIQFDVDFSQNPVMAASSSNAAQGALWDVALWDVDVWPSESAITKSWQSLANIGMSGSATIAVATNSAQLSLYSIDYIYEVGGPY